MSAGNVLFCLLFFQMWEQSGDTSIQLNVKEESLHLQNTDIISVNSLSERDP